MSVELMRRAIIDMILWTDDPKKMRHIYVLLGTLLKRREGEPGYE
jgi:hypothetical protein